MLVCIKTRKGVVCSAIPDPFSFLPVQQTMNRIIEARYQTIPSVNLANINIMERPLLSCSLSTN